MPEALWLRGGVCWNLCGLRGGGRPELLLAQGGVCRNIRGLRGCMPELLGA